MPAETIVFVNEPSDALGEIDIKGYFEKMIGDSSEASAVNEMGGELKNPKAAAYVDAIGQKLVSGTSRKDFGFKFGIVKSDVPNAFALPNGSIYITDGLLRMLNTEAQLANVLGHEVAHVTKHHTLGQIKTNLIARLGIESAGALFNGLFSKTLTGALTADDTETMKEMGYGLITSGYSRADESESDEVGQKLASRMGWSPVGMIDVMKVFLSLEKGKPEGIEAYMRSHPYSGDRVKEAEARVATLPTGGEIGEDRYKAFLEQTLKISPSETELSPVQKALRFVPGAAEASDKILVSTEGSILVPALAIGAAAVAIIIFIVLSSRR